MPRITVDEQSSQVLFEIAFKESLPREASIGNRESTNIISGYFLVDAMGRLTRNGFRGYARSAESLLEAVGFAGHSLSRPAPQFSHPIAEPGSASEGGPGNTRAQSDLDDAGHLLACAARHAPGRDGPIEQGDRGGRAGKV